MPSHSANVRWHTVVLILPSQAQSRARCAEHSTGSAFPLRHHLLGTMAQRSASLRTIYAAMVGNGLIAVTKFIAGAWTGGSAMIAEGVHSLVDMGNQLLLLRELRQAGRHPTPVAPPWHGRELFLELHCRSYHLLPRRRHRHALKVSCTSVSDILMDALWRSIEDSGGKAKAAKPAAKKADAAAQSRRGSAHPIGAA